MAFNPNDPYVGTWRDLETGVDPEFEDPYEADGANDGPGTPSSPIYTRLNGSGLPWWDPVENPFAETGLVPSPDPLPWSPREDVGVKMAPGAFESAFATRGSVQAFGHEVSGGMGGDQALGLIMRFPANIPERWDPYGVFTTDARDDLAAAMITDELPYRRETEITSDLLLWPNVWGRW